MANYFLNSDGSISTSKKRNGTNYQLSQDGKVSLINVSSTQSSSLAEYQKRKKELETQLLNYKREEANPWWDKKDNIIENVGNVVYKLVGEKKEDRYKKDEQYDALEKEYAEINKKIDDYLVENKKYDKGLLGYAQKSADVTAGNVRTSIDGINSTILKATGQKPIVYDSYAERVGNKAISQSKGAEKIGLEITGSVARMVPQMLMPTQTASMVVGFANYGGGAYNQAKKEGYDETKATLYGATIGGLEMGLQKLLGGFEKIYGKSVASRVTDKIMRKIITNSTLRSYITKVGGEFTEEYLQEFLNPIVRNVILEEENGADFWNASNLEDGVKQLSKNLFNKENLYAGALGGLTSGIMDSPALFVNNQTNRNSNSTKPTVPTVQDVVAQEKNSATASDELNPQSWTPETDSGTSSINVEANLPSSQSELLMDKSTSNANNIAQSNESVNQQNTKFNNEIDDALNDNQSKGNIYLGKPTNSKVINLIKKVTGIDVSNRNQVLSKDYVRHLFKHSKETNPNQIPVTIEDVKKIPDILSNPDTVVRGSDTLDASRKFMIPSVRYIKTDNTGKMFVVEAIPNKGNLQIKTMWKEPTKLIHGNNTRHHTSETANSKDSTTLIDNNIPQVDKNVNVPVINNNNTQNTRNNTNKIMNPNEISKIYLEDANTTPILPNKEVSTGRGESHFAKNIENKTDMLSKESKAEILDSNEVKYYQEITNKGSLEKAFKRLNEGGKNETESWLSKKDNFDDVDVAEGWILLKQYQDSIEKTNDLIEKDELNRSMVQVAKQMRYIGTKAGQTVQAYNILNRLTPEGMVYYAQSELSEAFEIMSKNKTKEWIDSNREQFNLTPQETEFIMKTMQEVQQMEDGYDKRVKLAEIQKVMTDKLPPSKGSGIKAWMRISMLFNPKTQVRNVMGNAIIAPVNVFGDLFASVVDKQIAKKTGVRTTGTINAKSYFSGFSKGAFQSYNDFKKGINTRNIQGNRFEINEGKSFNDNTAIGKALNRVDSILSFMLDAGDRTFYEATFTNSINNQLKLNNTTEVTQDMIDIATTEALSRTWQDNNDYTKFVLKMRQGLNMIHVPGLNGYGLGDVLIPFAKTPANLTKAIWDYSPAGLATTITKGINLKRALTNGQYNVQMQHQFVQSLGKATAGSMLYLLGIALAKAGITTGESDDDKDVANFMKNTLGISSYSIKIGNKSFTYDWAQPIAAPFSMTANFIQKQKEGADLKENIMSTLDTGLNVLFEQSFLESISNVLSESGQIGTKLIEQLLDLPSRAVPTLFKQIADLIDPVQRQSFEKDKPLETSINKVKAKVPILSKTLAPSVDTMGREIQKYGGKNNIFNVFLNPANVNTENISKSAAEIYRLYKITGDATIMPRVAPYNINRNGEKILLSSEQRAEYQEISGDIIENSIKELLNKSSYKNLSDIEKADIINKIVGYSYNKAREEVLGVEMSNTYSKINQYIYDGGKVSDYYLNKEEIDYSYNNPEKYQVITQIATYDKYLTYQDEIDNVKTKYTNSTQRKTAVIKYVNSLNLSIPQKAMLIKLNYSSYDSYNDKIIQYVNKQNLTKEEKTKILTKLGFTIRNGRVYS